MEKKQNQEVESPVAGDLLAPEAETSQVAAYLETIEELRRVREEERDLLLRRQAEFENYRRRVERERQEVARAARAEVLEALLPIVDAFERGLQTLEQASGESSLESYREGYRMMLREFETLLERFGVSRVAGVGATFDPNVHEALSREVSREHPEGQILEEFRSGYRLGDRLLRPGQVKVAVPPEAEQE